VVFFWVSQTKTTWPTTAVKPSKRMIGWACRAHQTSEMNTRFRSKKPEAKSTRGRLSRRWENFIKMDLKETNWRMLCGFGSEQESVAGSCEYGNKNSGSMKAMKFLEYLSKNLWEFAKFCYVNKESSHSKRLVIAHLSARFTCGSAPRGDWPSIVTKLPLS
jgi:hypothetical protein